MKKRCTYILFLIAWSLHGQVNMEIDGQVKVPNLKTDNTLDRVVLIDEAGKLVYRKADHLEPIEQSQFLDYQSNYADLGIGYTRGSFYKHGERVYLGGSVKTVSGRPSNGDVITILPPGYRPSNRILTYGRQQANVVRIDILTTGEILLQSGANNSSNFLSLEGIRFRLEPYAIGDIVGGGILFYIAEEGEDLNGDGVADRGLVAALNDLPGTWSWGCVNIDIPTAEGIGIGAGFLNTIEIVANCNEPNTAAKLASNLSSNNYRDWFLPSYDELSLMKNNLSGFAEERYWSSSQFAPPSAYFVNFGSGGIGTEFKPAMYIVRPIRVF